MSGAEVGEPDREVGFQNYMPEAGIVFIGENTGKAFVWPRADFAEHDMIVRYVAGSIMPVISQSVQFRHVKSFQIQQFSFKEIGRAHV